MDGTKSDLVSGSRRRQYVQYKLIRWKTVVNVARNKKSVHESSVNNVGGILACTSPFLGGLKKKASIADMTLSSETKQVPAKSLFYAVCSNSYNTTCSCDQLIMKYVQYVTCVMLSALPEG